MIWQAIFVAVYGIICMAAGAGLMLFYVKNSASKPTPVVEDDEPPRRR